MSSDSEPENVKEERCETKCDTTSKPVSKSRCSPEQLARLAEMRKKALEARRAKAEARKEEARRRVEEKEEKRITREVEKVKATKRPTKKKRDDSSDSDGGSPPVASAAVEPSFKDVDVKPKRKRKPVKVAVEASSSDSETEIVIRRPSRKGKKKAAPAPLDQVDPIPEVASGSAHASGRRMYTEEEVSHLFDQKLATFKKSQDEDEVMKLIRHMLPGYGR